MYVFIYLNQKYAWISISTGMRISVTIMCYDNITLVSKLNVAH